MSTVTFGAEESVSKSESLAECLKATQAGTIYWASRGHNARVSGITYIPNESETVGKVLVHRSANAAGSSTQPREAGTARGGIVAVRQQGGGVCRDNTRLRRVSQCSAGSSSVPVFGRRLWQSVAIVVMSVT